MPRRKASRIDSLYGARVAMEPIAFEVYYRLSGNADGELLLFRRELAFEQESPSRQLDFPEDGSDRLPRMRPSARDASINRGKQGDGRGEASQLGVFRHVKRGGHGKQPEMSDEGLDVDVVFDGEIVEASIEARLDVLIESCTLVMRHAFSSDEAVLLNGYQSWTDTAEKSAWSRMRGLRGVSSRLVERYVLDGGGDYDIIEYSARRGRQHGFTYATFRRGEGMVLVGSLDESHGFTIIRTDASQGELRLQTESPQHPLAAGERFVAGRYVVARGTMRECYDRWFLLSGVKARPIRPLVGYTSWYRHYGEIDEKKLTDDLAATRTFFYSLPHSELAGVQRVFQIDDGYCKVGDWLHVDAQKFPRGMKHLARRISAAGFLPGLWLAPFVCEKDSRLFRERPEWLLRDENGEPIATGSHWSGGYALDTRNTDVRSYVLDVLQTVTRDWGFGLLKLDFLYAACKKAHDGLNRGELMSDAIDLLRRGAGENVLLLGCGVPLGSVFGKFDYCRIGCDVGLDWDDLPHMRVLHRERISTKNSLTNTYARAPLDGRAFGIDPDVFFLRHDVRLTNTQRDELLFADADLGSVLLTSDDMSAWSRSERERYLQALRIISERHVSHG